MKLQHIRILLAVVLPLIIGVCVSIRTQAIGEPLPTLSGTKAIEYLKQNSQYDSLMEAFAATRKGQTDETPTDDAFEQTAHLIASDGASVDQFGIRVAISGDTAIVGAYLDDVGANSNQGSAYIFVRSGTVWSEQQKLTAADGAASDFFGGSVAISGETAIVGAYNDNVGANTDQGSVYIFVRSGTTWSEQQKLTASDGASNDLFGFRVAIFGETAIVGTLQDDVGANTNQGSAHIFVRSGTVWSEQQKLTASDGASNDQFGCSVAISGETAIVGVRFDDVGANTDQGSAYIFVRSGTVWSEQQKLTAADGAAVDRFGFHVAISGETAIIGAYVDDDLGDASGSAYIFVRSGTVWSQQQKLTASDGAAGDQFGASVAISGETAIVGAPEDDDLGGLSGSAYVFIRFGTTWSEQQKLTASDGAANDRFGFSVAISGDTAIVGAYFDDIGANTDQGSAYVFTQTAATPTPTPTPTATDTPTSTPIDTPTDTPTPEPTPTPGGCVNDTWTPTTLTGATSARFSISNMAVWTGSEMIVWGGRNGGSYNNTGGRYNPVTDSWTPTSTVNTPTARSSHTAVWTGSEMIVWGGFGPAATNTGGRYNPATDSWRPMSIDNAPAARSDHTAVWTGSEMIVWGGLVTGSPANSGGRYNPVTDSWTPTSSENVPGVRNFHTAVWTGSEMIVWGGGNPNLINTGGRYTPVTDSWTPTSSENVPGVRNFHTAVWTGSEMIVWGGQSPTLLNTGGRYNPGTDSWSPTSLANTPRSQHIAVWTGTEMIVWGGRTNAGNTGGGRYDPETDGWTATNTTNEPAPRRFLSGVWTGSEMIVWGGEISPLNTGVNTGGRYCAESVSPAISGTVTYGNAIGTPTPRFVSNVTITGAGSPNVFTTTAAPGPIAGQYSLTGFGSGAYTVTPSKSGGVNGAISSFDAGRIALHVAGAPNPQLNATQLIVADVSGNGTISSFDAGQIARYAAGVPGSGSTGNWIFMPVNRSYASVTGNITGEDFVALLMGEVSGNWTNTGARPAGGGAAPLDMDADRKNTAFPPSDGQSPGMQGPERAAVVDLPTLVASVDKEIIVPVNVQGAANKGIISYEFDLRYDPAVIQPLAEPVDVAGTISRGLSVVTNATEPGLLRVVVYGAMPIDSDGLLLNLRFQAVGVPSAMSPLTFERIMFNEGDPGTFATDGRVEIRL